MGNVIVGGSFRSRGLVPPRVHPTNGRLKRHAHRTAKAEWLLRSCPLEDDT